MSIVIKKMRWSNLFSYGENNEIDFTRAPLTQLVGINGQGKSSIALILEIALFNKNSKGIKSGDILNRNNGSTFYNIEVEFSKLEDEYLVKVKRASTQTVKIFKNGVDVSSHTATGSFKLIETILGFDHKVFCQLFYQSSAQSLEFLSATDTARKKFLVEFLNLTKYSEAFEVFKAKAKEVSQSVLVLETRYKTIDSFIVKHSGKDLTPKEKTECPEPPTALVSKAAVLRQELNEIASTNKKIQANAKYKELLDSIDLSDIDESLAMQDDTKLHSELGSVTRDIKEAESFIHMVSTLSSECPTCKHPIDNSKHLQLLSSKLAVAAASKVQLADIKTKLNEISENNKIVSKNLKRKQEWEQYYSLFKEDEKTEILDEKELKATILQLEKDIENISNLVKSIDASNREVDKHNATVSVLSEQLSDMTEDISVVSKDLVEVRKTLTKLNVLMKAFSTNGLTAYKIESMIKDLEEQVNFYLAEFSHGRFQLSFVIAGDKLDVVISDNGHDVGMSSLSNGEKARVNTATLLAIRKVMQQLSKVKVNLLILDETIDNLDVEGKEKLVEILLSDTYLNTFIVSHGYSHPLLEKLHVVKDNDISRIEV